MKERSRTLPPDGPWTPRGALSQTTRQGGEEIRDTITPYLNEADRPARLPKKQRAEALAADRALDRNHVPEPPPPEFTDRRRSETAAALRLVDGRRRSLPTSTR